MSGRRAAIITCLLFTAIAVGLCSFSIVDAAVFQRIRIGDRDGFGFGTGEGLLNFQGDPVNVDGVGVLSEEPPGDFLPDLNQDGLVQHFQGDDFDNRSVAEIAGDFIEGSGFSDTGSVGAQFTDLSLSQSYDTTFPPPNDFPDPPPTNRNDAHFEFRFFVETSNIDSGQPIFFNIVFGDIGAISGELTVSFADGSGVTVTIDPINPSIEDGLIRGAALEFDFADIFTSVAGGWEGYADVDVVTRPGIAGGDPFYALDFVELSQAPLNGPGLVPATLIVSKSSTFPGDLVLSWDPSCNGAADDYAIYEGEIGNWYSHIIADCSDDGADLTEEIAPSVVLDGSDRYYVVVPLTSTNSGLEGSYGTQSTGDERPFAVAPCIDAHAIGCP